VLQFLNTQSLLIAGLLVLGVACTSQPAPKPSAAPSVVAATAVSAEAARRTGIQQSLSYTGDIRPREQIRPCPNRPDASSRCSSILAVRSRPAKGWPRVEDIAAGNAALAQQQTRLSKMRSGGRSEDILASEAGLTAAEAKLTCTPDQLSEVVRGFGADIPGVKVTAAPISQFGPGGASVQVRVQGDLIGNALHAEAVHINGDPADDRRQRGQDIAEASVRKAAVGPHWR
jgi:hypothetical protein